MEEPEGLDLPRIPLTPYDILGYVTPGSTLLICVLGFEYEIRRILPSALKSDVTPDTPLFSLLTDLYTRALSSNNWISLALLGLVVLGVAYVAGHVIASLSSFLVDRILIFKGYGYPYAILLGLHDDRRSANSYSGAFYRGLFFWLNAYLAGRYTLIFLHKFMDQTLYYTALRALVHASGWLVALAIPAKIMVSGIDHRNNKAGAAFDRELSMSNFRNCILARKTVPALLILTKSLLVNVVAGPYDLVSKFLGGIINSRRSFDEQFVNRYKMWFKKRFNVNADEAQTNNFWYSYSYVMRHSGVLTSRLTHWLTLYVFARNLSTAFYISFLYCFAWLLHSGSEVYSSGGKVAGEVLGLPLLFLALSFTMLVRFYYLFVGRFTKVVLRSFVFLNEISEETARA